MPGGSNCYQLDCADTRTLFFSVKVPQIITHETALVDCEAELVEFLKTMGLFGNELGPIVSSFRFFNRSIFKDHHEFLDRLVPFLRKLPRGYKFAIEIRNQGWLDDDHRLSLERNGPRLGISRSERRGDGAVAGRGATMSGAGIALKATGDQ